MPLSRFLRLRLPVRFSMAVWLSEGWRWPLSSVYLSAMPLLLASRSGVPRSRYLRAGVTGADAGPEPLVIVTRRVLREAGSSRRRGSADEMAGLLSAGDCGFEKLESRGAAARKLFTSVMALDGARKRDSSSSSKFFLARRSSEVLRPSRLSSGSSVPALLDLSRSDDLLPGCSSGSSVAARRIRARRRDDLRPALIGSSGVVGAAVYRGLGSIVVASIDCLFCSRVVGARGLALGFVIVSARALGRLWAEVAPGLMVVGLSKSSFSRAAAVA